MSTGVIYMTWGQNAINEADNSMASLRRIAPGMQVFIVGDCIAEKHYSHPKWSNHVQFKHVDVDPFGPDGRFMAGRIKPLLAKLTPFDHNLYIDADTVFVRHPNIGFGFLDKWDVLVSETQDRSLNDTIAGYQESKWTKAWLETGAPLYHNSGMIFWRKNEVTERLFDLWSEEWQRFSDWDEQVALLRAILRCDNVLVQHTPYSWNCLHVEDAYLLHHRFGTRIAWKHPTARPSFTRGRKGRLTPAHGPIHVQMERQRMLSSGRSPDAGALVNVEVSRGVFVQCRAGEEHIVTERHRTRAEDAAKRSKK